MPVVLGFGPFNFDTDDLVLVAMLTGEWSRFVADVGRGLHLQSTDAAAVSPAEVDDAVIELRYARGLIAAAEMQAWLVEQHLELSDVRDVLHRKLLREKVSTTATAPASASDLHVEAVCTGAHARWARMLRNWCAAESYAAGAPVDNVEQVLAEALAADVGELGEGRLRQRIGQLAMLQNCFRLVTETAVTPAQVSARLTAHRLDWTVVSGSMLSFAREGAARETRMLVAVDGWSMADVAQMLGLDLVLGQIPIGDAPQAIQADLRAVVAGELIGPWRDGDTWSLMYIERRAEPADDAARQRAHSELVDELLDRLAAGKVSYLATF